jgi:hypothetical protein
MDTSLPLAPPRPRSAASPRRLATWAALLVVALLPYAVFWSLWLPAPAARASLVHGDLTEQHLPMRTFVAREYRAGRLPIWSPDTLSGEPSAANSVFSIFYPLGLWEVLFPTLPFLALELEILANLALAGVFTLLYVREITGSLGAGLLSGVVFSLSGFLTSYPMLQMIILQVAVWLPAGLWLLERGLRRRSLRHVALAGAAFGVGILGGHFQTVLYTAYAAGAYLVYRLVGERVGWRWALGAAGILGLVTLGVGAPQWLPSAEIIARSTRGRLGYDEIAHGFDLAAWWGLLRPNPGQWSPLYVGWVALALAGGALAMGAARRSGLPWRRGQAAFWGAVAALSLLASLGKNGFLYPLLYRAAPGFALFRDQERAAFLVTFALATLAGLGYAALRDWGAGGAGRLVRSRVALVVLVALVALDLARANGGMREPLPPGGWEAPTPAATYLQEHAAEGWARVSSEGLLPLDGNAALRYGYRDTTGNGPLQIGAYDRFIATVPELRWWQMLNVRHVVTRRVLDHPGLHLALEDPARDERVYTLEIGSRDAWIAHDVAVASDGEEALALAADAALDPFATAVLERPPDPPPAPAVGPDAVRVAAVYPWKVIVEATLASPGILVVSEVDYPGWGVRVNGGRAEALRAYGVLRAVALPAGTHRVEWAFRPLSVFAGLGWAAITLLAVAGACLWGRRRNPTAP